MFISFFFLTCCFVSLAWTRCPVCTDVRNFKNMLNQDTALEGSSLLVVKDVGLLQCVKECMTRTECLSFNFDIAVMTCELKYNSTLAVVFRKGSFCGLIRNWPQKLAGSCAYHSCLPNTVCSSVTSSTATCVTEKYTLGSRSKKTPITSKKKTPRKIPKKNTPMPSILMSKVNTILEDSLISPSENTPKKKKPKKNTRRKNVTTQTGKLPIPDEHIRYKRGGHRFSYKLYKNKTKFEDGLKICRQDGGKILQLNNKQKNIIITKYLTGYAGCFTDKSLTEKHVSQRLQKFYKKNWFQTCQYLCGVYSFYGIQERNRCFCMTMLQYKAQRKVRSIKCQRKYNGNKYLPCGRIRSVAIFKKELTSIAETVYIGLTDVESKGLWLWEDAGRADTLNFAGAQNKKSLNSRHCVVLSKNHDWKWVNVKCYKKHYFMCEMSN